MGNSNSGFFQTPQAAANTCGIELDELEAYEKAKHITADWIEGRKYFRKSEINFLKSETTKAPSFNPAARRP